MSVPRRSIWRCTANPGRWRTWTVISACEAPWISGASRSRGSPGRCGCRGALHCNSGWALVDAALKGLGIVQLPEYYVQAHLDTGRLVPLLTPYQVADDGIWGLYPRTRHLSAKVRMMLDHLERNL